MMLTNLIYTDLEHNSVGALWDHKTLGLIPTTIDLLNDDRQELLDFVETIKDEIAPYSGSELEQIMIQDENLTSIAAAKQAITDEINAITIDVDGHVFDANEISQSRISIRVSSMTTDESIARWKLADNSWVTVTKRQFLDVLEAAAEKTTVIMGGGIIGIVDDELGN